MITPYTPFELLLYLFLYAALGWALEVSLFALRDRRFINRGFLTLPLNLPCGITAVILMLALPTLEHNIPLQYLTCLIVFKIVRRFSEQFVRNRRRAFSYREAADFSQLTENIFAALIAALFLVSYLVVHPLVMALLHPLPDWLMELASLSLVVLVAADYITVCYALSPGSSERRMAKTQRLGDRLTRSIWARLQKAYPGAELEDDLIDTPYVFAQGICRDKLIWVFLVSSFLGALIEMLYCRAMGDIWMSRSSLLYGPFSVVWGVGAVVLTVVLQRFAGKDDRYVFLAGFVVGGVYEYLCSVFTELVFGTVFWDYSWMPLNIGGRTNVLYCIFWGILAVVWIKVIYPPMSRGIERIPALPGKLLTWLIVFVMACNGVLTCAAMMRYTARQTQPQAQNAVERFLDARYDDEFMEKRWPNMMIPQAAEAE